MALTASLILVLPEPGAEEYSLSSGAASIDVSGQGVTRLGGQQIGGPSDREASDELALAPDQQRVGVPVSAADEESDGSAASPAPIPAGAFDPEAWLPDLRDLPAPTTTTSAPEPEPEAPATTEAEATAVQSTTSDPAPTTAVTDESAPADAATDGESAATQADPERADPDGVVTGDAATGITEADPAPDTSVAEPEQPSPAAPEQPEPTTPPEPTEPTWVDAGNGVLVPPVLLAIRYCESRDDYVAANRSSSARGAYQFVSISWGHYGHKDRYGVDQAHLATPAQQDEAALLTWQRDGTRPWNASKSCWSKRI